METKKRSTWKRLPRCKNGFHRNKVNETCEKVQQEKHEKKKTSSMSLLKKSSSSSITKKNVAAAKIQKFARRTLTKKRQQELKQQEVEQEETKHEKAERKLKSFFKKNLGTIREKVRGKFLKSICSDSGVCIAFGKEEDKIKKFFNGFVDFQYAVSRRRVGSVSVNGFVYEITYERDDYLAHAVLKSSSRAQADNLSYEFFVGKIINKHFLKKFPCFNETYGLYQYKHTDNYDEMKSGNKSMSLQDAISLVTSPDIKMECEKSQYLALLTQNIKNAKSFKSMLTSDFLKTRGFANDVASCLFQVYFALAEVANQFTHYDLHHDNVLIYEPVAGKYIQYKYICSDGKVCKFKSRFLVKIIDYGRSFILEPGTSEGSLAEYNRVCAEPACVSTCGDEVGYAWMDPAPNQYFLNTTKRNSSHDLWLLAIMFDVHSARFPKKLKDLLSNVQYGNDVGTEEDLEEGYPEFINNVVDAMKFLRDYLNEPDEVKMNNYFHSDNYTLDVTKLGDLVVESGKDMIYTPVR
jgi:hypothetical protein